MALITVTSVDPATCSLKVKIQLLLNYIRWGIVDDQGRLLESSEPHSNEPVFLLTFDQSQRSAIEGVPFVQSPLSTTVGLPFESSSGVPASISLACSAQDFPNDSYSLDQLTVRLSVGQPYQLVERFEDHTQPTDMTIPLFLAVAAGDHLVDWTMESEPAGPTPDPLGSVTVINGSISRPVDYALFVYGVALAPMLLGFAALAQWTVAQNTRKPAELSLGFAAALVALLPLRQVLVPAEIPGLTRVDRLLGVEVVAIVVIIVCTVAFQGNDE